MKKKKKKARPSKTSLKREARLQRAEEWIGANSGKNIFSGTKKEEINGRRIENPQRLQG